MREYVLAMASLAGRTGRGVRVAIVDSGIHLNHPHVSASAVGVGIDDFGAMDGDFIDRIGHGTAVTAVIHEKAPEAELFVAKVFDRSLTATATALSTAIRWAADQGAHLINLSLGTTNPAHANELGDAVAHARQAGAVIVAAAPDASHHWLPGALAGVIAVELDWTCGRDMCQVTADDGDVRRVRASGYPRPIPGVPPERNLKGHSFAVANATGLLALSRERPDR